MTEINVLEKSTSKLISLATIYDMLRVEMICSTAKISKNSKGGSNDIREMILYVNNGLANNWTY